MSGLARANFFGKSIDKFTFLWYNTYTKKKGNKNYGN